MILDETEIMELRISICDELSAELILIFEK